MPAKSYERTTAGLREVLFDTILGVKDGSISREDAQAIVNTSKSIVATLDVELRAQRAAFEMKLGNEDAKVLAPPMLQLCDDRKPQE